MQRYFVGEDLGEIIGQDKHHILKVIKLKTGDNIITCFNHLGCYLSKITIDNNNVYYQKVNKLVDNKKYNITLVQGIPKGNKLEFIIKYTTIFSISNIIFLNMKRSVNKLFNQEHKLNRYQLIAKEAAELSHQFEIPKIEIIDKIQKLDFSNYDILILFDEEEKDKILFNHIDEIKNYHKILFLIGPEGGISDEERNYLESKGFIKMSLGSRILTTESASLSFLSYFLT